MGNLLQYPTPLDGKSAYEIAVDNGYVGTEAQWLLSLHGADGDTPVVGANGNWFIGGSDTGKPSRGLTGLSAYQIWLNNGHLGTEAQFLAWLQADISDLGVPQIWDMGSGANIQNMTGSGKYVKIGKMITLSGFAAVSGASTIAQCLLPFPCGNIGVTKQHIARTGSSPNEKDYYALIGAGSQFLKIDIHTSADSFSFCMSYFSV